jgi:hypothetical protein
VQELAESKKRLVAQEKEGVRLTQLLDIEKSSFAEAKEELQGVRLEINDLIAQRARDSAQVAAAEDLRRQWEAVQVEFLDHAYRFRHRLDSWAPEQPRSQPTKHVFTRMLHLTDIILPVAFALCVFSWVEALQQPSTVCVSCIHAGVCIHRCLDFIVSLCSQFLQLQV